MWVIGAGGSLTWIEERRWSKGPGRSATANTRNVKSIAFLCSQLCGMVGTEMRSTFLGLVAVLAGQAS